jgi:hypothetical protein
MRPTSPHPITCPGLLAVVAMLLAGVAPGAAQDTLCTAQRAGQVACIAGRLCTCQLAPASMATRLPDGLRWDCGILRPPCGEAVPATLDPWPN